MTDQLLWFQLQMKSYSRNWNTPYWSLIVTAGEFKKCHRNVWNALEWIEHQFLSGIKDSRKAGSLWGMMRGVKEVRKSIHHSWLVKGLGLLCWGFKGVQEEIPGEEASTLQIWSVAFPPDNTPVHNSILVTDYLTKMGINTVPQTLLPATFAYSLCSEAVVVMR